MLRRVITAKDGEKVLSLEYSLISKDWKLSKKSGKVLCLVPSDRSFIKVERFEEQNKKAVISRLKEYAKERFPESKMDFSIVQDRIYTAFCRDCDSCDYVELEPFALARLYQMYGKDGFVIDWGRRKTVFVEVRDGFLQSFRVVLRGGEYITQKLAESRGVSIKEAENMKRLEGLSLKEVEESVKEVLELSGYSFENKSVLLVGGGSKLKGLRALFSETLRFDLCEPEYAVCLGACLRELLKNPYPDFTKKELTQEDIKSLTFSVGGLVLMFILSLYAIQRLYSVEELKEAQRAEFKKLFPREPIVSLHEQVKTKVSTGEEYKLTKLLLKSRESLKPGMKLYRFEYADGRLTLKGEADRELLRGLKLHSTKDTTGGRVEFEVRVP